MNNEREIGMKLTPRKQLLKEAVKELKTIRGSVMMDETMNNDDELPFGSIGTKSILFNNRQSIVNCGIITSKHGDRKSTFKLPISKKEYESVVKRVLQQHPHSGFGANVRGANAAYEIFKKMAVEKGIDISE
jgi:hypothetical protein